ncbi:MAG: hypothetical protein SPL10_07745 [Synergistales bacterium]|nr:hypothetical protein [Synergistales bacterium]MDY6401681.1 hypothetical protein [Synergistales bacterium]MDY6404239.1 hypothetical protein [Synergistales bacterium]MDY6411237.1 hypothetical protein [Synergistales bacterium]MDY6415033.1 hypothetical protein [Synergistales bacterium]
MAWIEAHQELPRHPKTKRFARMLKISIPQAVGHLFMFWWWALDYAENGDLSRYDADDLADAAQWDGDPEEFLKAMIECGPGGSYGFIEKNESGMFVHDWEMYSGRLVEKREKNRQRQAKGRKNNTEEKKSKHVARESRVTSKSVARESQGYTTQQNTTEHNRTEPTQQHTTATEPTPAPPAPKKAAAAKGEEINLGEIVQLWNEKLAPLGFSHVLKKTPSREKALQTLLDTSAERKKVLWWQKVFDRVSSSEFLKNSVQERNWFTLDWLLNENNLVKLLEGRYDNRHEKIQKPVKSIAEILEQHSQNSHAIDAEYSMTGEGEARDGERPPGF